LRHEEFTVAQIDCSAAGADLPNAENAVNLIQFLRLVLAARDDCGIPGSAGNGEAAGRALLQEKQFGDILVRNIRCLIWF